MPFLALRVLCSSLLDLAHVLTRSDQANGLELLLLRQQLRVYGPKGQAATPARWEKVPRASLAARPPELSRGFCCMGVGRLNRRCWRRLGPTLVASTYAAARVPRGPRCGENGAASEAAHTYATEPIKVERPTLYCANTPSAASSWHSCGPSASTRARIEYSPTTAT